MNEVRLLSRLQSIDLEIDSASLELNQVQAGFGQSPELVAAREALEESRRLLHEAQTAQRELEWEFERLTNKLGEEEEKLYGGKVKLSRELENIKREVDILSANRREVEDRLLDVMTEVESDEKNVKNAQDELQEIARIWENGQHELNERQNFIQDRLVELKTSRKSVAVSAAPAIIAHYEELRRIKQGRGVVRIERNTCQGCRIGLPTTTVQHVRIGKEIVHCPSCGRILFIEQH